VQHLRFQSKKLKSKALNLQAYIPWVEVLDSHFQVILLTFYYWPSEKKKKKRKRKKERKKKKDLNIYFLAIALLQPGVKASN